MYEFVVWMHRVGGVATTWITSGTWFTNPPVVARGSPLRQRLLKRYKSMAFMMYSIFIIVIAVHLSMYFHDQTPDRWMPSFNIRYRLRTTGFLH